MATWDVSLFAYLRDRHGPSITIESEPNPRAILQALANAGVNVESCRLAVGDEFANLEDAVPVGSQIALIPPVSGG